MHMSSGIVEDSISGLLYIRIHLVQSMLEMRDTLASITPIQDIDISHGVDGIFVGKFSRAKYYYSVN